MTAKVKALPHSLTDPQSILFVRSEQYRALSTEIEYDDDRNSKSVTLSFGKLNGLGLRAENALADEIEDYLVREWGLDKETDKCSSRAGNVVKDFLRKRGWVILLADTTQALDCDTLIELQRFDPDFVFECYKTAIRLNPTANPEFAAFLEENERADESESETDPLA